MVTQNLQFEEVMGDLKVITVGRSVV
jgi:hypothetical protein